LLFALYRVLLSHYHALHKFVSLGTILADEIDVLTALEKLSDLLRGEPFCVLHPYLHPAADSLALSHFQDHLVLESIPLSGSSCIGQLFG
jgi:hypothetical protein